MLYENVIALLHRIFFFFVENVDLDMSRVVFPARFYLIENHFMCPSTDDLIRYSAGASLAWIIDPQELEVINWL